MTEFLTKRAYETPAASDGVRILVDRVWPRGIKKTELEAEWDKDVAPSRQLRQDWDHDPERWEWFQQQYRAELDAHAQDVLAEFREQIGDAKTVTLVYGAKDEHHNQALVLADWLGEKLGQ